MANAQDWTVEPIEGTGIGHSAYLGDARTSVMTANLLNALSRAQPRYRIRWRGTNVPRGIPFGLGVIAWAQHGILAGRQGEMLGTYSRESSFAGPGQDEHSMVATVAKSLRVGDNLTHINGEHGTVSSVGTHHVCVDCDGSTWTGDMAAFEAEWEEDKAVEANS